MKISVNGIERDATQSEEAEITAFQAAIAALPVPFPRLRKWQLWLAALELPTPIKKVDVLARIDGMADLSDVEKETVRIMLTDAEAYERADPRIDLLAQAMGIPPEQMDSLWRWAAQFSSM